MFVRHQPGPTLAAVRAAGHDFDQQFLNVELVLCKILLQFVQPVGAVGKNGLLHRVVEQLLDERGLRFVAGGHERGQVLQPLNFAISPDCVK